MRLFVYLRRSVAFVFLFVGVSCGSEEAGAPRSSDGGAGVGGTGGSATAGTGDEPGGSTSGSGTSGGNSAGGVDAGDTDPTCSARSGGALVAFHICDEDLILWVTNDAFVTEAIHLLGTGESRIACFPGLREGRDCDPAHSWHGDPASAYWSDFELETYFDCPGEVEKDKAHWVEQIGQYCGEHTTVTAVDDRR